MTITCDECKSTGKGTYTSRWIDGKVVTMCDDCRYGRKLSRNTKSEKEVYDSLQIPFWKLMGQKAKPKDIAYEKYLKSKNMTYGDAVRERNSHGTEKSAYEDFRKAC
jgi:ribosome-binding protein aMBF1 (putative translation factor)